MGYVLIVVAALMILRPVAQRALQRGGLHRWLGKARRRSAIGAGRQGVVHIQGRIGPAVDALRAPLSGAACVFYDLELSNLVDDEGGRLWNDEAPKARRQYRGVWFTIDDGTGTALVRFDGSGRGPTLRLSEDGPPDVQCTIPPSVFWGHGAVDIDRPDAQAVLTEAGVATIQRKVKMTEGLLLPGDTVTVVGYGATELDPAGQRQGYREVPSRYVVTHHGRQPLVIVREQAGPAHQTIRCALLPPGRPAG